MSENDRKSKSSSLKRSLLEWFVIAAIAVLLYATGWYTEVLGTMQRGLLWTGLFDAQGTEHAMTRGQQLSDADYRFTLLSPAREKILFDDFKGKVLFVNIWASWCPPCVAEMPTIEELYSDIPAGSDIRFLTISLDQDRSKAVRFMERKAFSMPYYFPAEDFPGLFKSSKIPSTFVISKDGRVVYKKEGLASYDSPDFKSWLMRLAK